MLLFIVLDDVCRWTAHPRHEESASPSREALLDVKGRARGLNPLTYGCKLEIYGTAALTGERDVRADGAPTVECDTRRSGGISAFRTINRATIAETD